MKSKHAEHKHPQPPRDPARDCHSAKEKELGTVKEGAKSGHKGKSDK